MEKRSGGFQVILPICPRTIFCFPGRPSWTMCACTDGSTALWRKCGSGPGNIFLYLVWRGMKTAILPLFPAGWRQRAAFLRTALCSADILLLDEPFGALDVITRGEMQDWLLAMRKELGKTVVLVTHDMDEAIYLSDRILILNPAPAGIHGEISVCETQRDRDWLYGQGELRREIHGRIMGKERKGNAAL